jgi:methyl-accepting chemotaxis protein
VTNWLKEHFILGPVSEYERDYLRRVNRGFLYLLLAHLPLVPLLAYAFKTSYLEGFLLFAAVMSAPVLMVRFLPTERSTSCVLAFAGIGLSGILIHLAKGMIEFHFHIFVALAWTIIFGNPWALITAAATAAVHHVALFLLLPSSVFNYEATFSTVLLHAAFVVAETAINILVSNRIQRLVASQSKLSWKCVGVQKTVAEMTESFAVSASELKSQSDSLQSAASAVTEISQMASSTADYARDASKAGNTMNADVSQGKEGIARLRERFEVLLKSAENNATNIQESFKKIEELLTFFNEIDSKTKIINDIVFQTKLLSFNASVEAARAGEHGKGFAVVAEEIGNLAQMSGKAAKEINTLLSSGTERSKAIISEAVTHAQKSSHEMREAVFSSSKQTEDCLVSFTQIERSLGIAIESLNQIARANEDQKQGIQSLAATFSRVVQATDGISQKAQQASSQGRSMTERSLRELRETLEEILDSTDRNDDSNPSAPSSETAPRNSLAA